MNVYVSSGLDNIKENLRVKGYKILNSISDDQCDAIICNLKNGGLVDIQKDNCLKKEGTLIIDSGSRSADEIESILINRSYSSIF